MPSDKFDDANYALQGIDARSDKGILEVRVVSVEEHHDNKMTGMPRRERGMALMRREIRNLDLENNYLRQ